MEREDRLSVLHLAIEFLSAKARELRDISDVFTEVAEDLEFAHQRFFLTKSAEVDSVIRRLNDIAEDLTKQGYAR